MSGGGRPQFDPAPGSGFRPRALVPGPVSAFAASPNASVASMSAPGPASAQIVVVAALWHRQITDALIAGAERVLGDVGYDWSVIRVPGTFELPLGVQRAFADPSVDGALALGVVIRGGTPHFEYVCRAATDGLLRVSLDARRPVGFGVLTCDTEEQAFDRAGLAHSREDKGAETARAVLAMLSR